jgi:hypothetical protein
LLLTIFNIHKVISVFTITIISRSTRRQRHIRGILFEAIFYRSTGEVIRGSLIFVGHYLTSPDDPAAKLSETRRRRSLTCPRDEAEWMYAGDPSAKKD